MAWCTVPTRESKRKEKEIIIGDSRPGTSARRALKLFKL
jgi:hypothetical protein